MPLMLIKVEIYGQQVLDATFSNPTNLNDSTVVNWLNHFGYLPDQIDILYPSRSGLGKVIGFLFHCPKVQGQ